MNNIYIAKVISGIKKGTELGFPTINLESNLIKDLEFGVYACKVYINKEEYKGVMHFGPKSIGIEDKEKIYCEIHLININKELNPKEIKVKVLKNIRSVREFKSDDELKIQIQKDIDIANNFFSYAE